VLELTDEATDLAASLNWQRRNSASAAEDASHIANFPPPGADSTDELSRLTWMLPISPCGRHEDGFPRTFTRFGLPSVRLSDLQARDSTTSGTLCRREPSIRSHYSAVLQESRDHLYQRDNQFGGRTSGHPICALTGKRKPDESARKGRLIRIASEP